MKVEQYISKEFLLDQYLQQEKSIRQIARETGKSTHCVKCSLLRYSITIRKFKELFSKQFLIEEYTVNQKSSHQIAQEAGVGHWVVLKRLKKYGIPRRTSSRKGRPSVSHHHSKLPINAGGRFGKLTAIKIIEGLGPIKWECMCDCGVSIIATLRDLNRSRIKSCGCLKNVKCIGYKGISGNLFNRYKIGAKSRNILFDITPKDVWEVFLKQDGKCAISGVLLTLSPQDVRTASIDRIDSKKGYTTDNIQWVHKTINTMKWDIDCDQFIEWCKIVAKNNGQS